MKEQFNRKLRLSRANKIMLATINEILEEYINDGYVLTLRQLYYQLVSRDIIPNQDKQYKNLMNILKKGRMAGIIDWEAIEDRIRKPQLPYWVLDIPDAINDMVEQYRLNRMRGQLHNIEVWIEKDALSSVFYRVTSKYHIRLMVNRGYSSVTAMYDAYRRLKTGDTILYFGDHDPSGLDMIRDIRERLSDFGLIVNVVPVALNQEQIAQYNPPPNPTKVSDPRAKWYIEEWGHTCWELDALPPKVLNQMTEEEILKRINLDLYNDMLEQEKSDIKEIKSKFNLDETD